MAVGDLSVQVIQQTFDKDLPKGIDWSRTGRMLVAGVVLGPINHGWYKFLDHILPLATPSIVARKILLDQVIGSPVMTYVFFTSGGLLEGKSHQDTWDELKQKFLTVYKADWAFWPPVQFVNFYFIQPKFRVLYVSVAALVWSTFLSFAKHKDDLGSKSRKASIANSEAQESRS